MLTTGPTGLEHARFIALFVVLVVAPIATTAFLASRLKRGRP